MSLYRWIKTMAKNIAPAAVLPSTTASVADPRRALMNKEYA